MFETISKYFRELDRRINVLFIFLGIHTWHRNLPAQYNQLYATSLGANPIELEIFIAIPIMSTIPDTRIQFQITDETTGKTD